MWTIDWKSGCASAGKTGESKSIVVTGDWAPVWDSVDHTIYDDVMAQYPEKCYGGVLDVLKNADLRIVNLECVIEGRTPALKGGPHLVAYKRHLPCLKAGGFDIAALANNHICDYGSEGIETTRRTLDAMNIKYTGAGANDREAWEPAICELDGLRVGIVNFSEGHDCGTATADTFGMAGFDIDRACRTIRELRKTCDIVIAIPHCGIEFAAHPANYCFESYRKLASAHPDAIIAHHPHVPQGLEIRDGVPIFYSLGNFLFHMGTPLHFRRHGFVVELEVAKNGLNGFRIHPYKLNDDGLELLSGTRKEKFLGTIRRLSQDLDAPYAGYHALLKEHWYRGFPKWHLSQVIRAFDSNPPFAAALLRNRLTTPQHTNLYLPMCERVMNGTIDDAPDAMLEIEKEYETRQL